MNLFREETIRVNGETIVLKKKPFNEIFEYNNPPYLCVGASGAGKTTIAIDIIFSLSKTASKIYYVSATQENVSESSISAIPKLYRRSPHIEDLDNVWKEIKRTSEQSKVTPETLLQLIGKIYPSKDTNTINLKLKEYENEVKSDLTNKYKNLTDLEQKQNIMDDLQALKLEILTRLILNGVEQYGSKNLSATDINIVSNLVSTEQKTILILDDISAELTALKTSKRKYYFNDNMMSCADAYKSILTDILTKARHYNCVCVIFVHGWNIIDLKSLTTNFIILDETAASNMRMLRSISDLAIKSAQAAADIVFNKYKHHFVVIRNGGKDICVGCADLHIGDKLELNTLNKNLLEAYSEILNNTDFDNVPLQQSEEEEDESSEELSVEDI